MKTPVILLAAMAAAAPLAAQVPDSAATKKPMKMEMEDHAMSGWKELDTFHMVMMATWHPASMKKDLAPARARADELAARAEAWAKSAFPKPCDTPALREAVNQTATGSKAFAALVKEGTDAQLTEALKAVHDRFEVVEKGCKPGASHH